MLGFILAFLAAICHSAKDVLNKRTFAHTDEYTIAFATILVGTIIVSPLLLISGIPELGRMFWPALIANSILYCIQFMLAIKAIKYSDVSLVSPIQAFGPIFLLLVSPIMIHEFPNAIGLAGVVLGVIGAYILKIEERHKGILEPFKALFKEKGPKLMFIAVFLSSITSSLDKIGVLNSSVLFWIVIYNIGILACIIPVALYKSPKNAIHIFTKYKMLVPIGIAYALTGIFHLLAITYTLVVYVLSIKRLSILFSVLSGHYFLKEKGIAQRLIAASIMIIGIILIAISHFY